MSMILTLCCDTADCRAMVHGEEAINVVERVYPIGTAYLEVGDAVIEDYERLSLDLAAKALAAGWRKKNDREWLCNVCVGKAIIELNRCAIAGLDKWAESVAHSMNV